MATKTSTVPNPGSDEALASGCTCAVLDNAHGKGFPYKGGTSFWITEGCPVHFPKSDTAKDPRP